MARGTLDVVLTNCDQTLLGPPTVIDDLSRYNSDHMGILMRVNLRYTLRFRQLFAYQCNEVNFARFRSNLKNVLQAERVIWRSLRTKSQSVVARWPVFRDLVKWAFFDAMPRVLRKHDGKPPWYNSELRMRAAKVETLRRASWRSGHLRRSAAYMRWKQAEEIMDMKVDKAHESFEQKFVGMLGPNRNALFREMQKLRDGNEGVSPLVTEDGRILFKDSEKAAHMNAYTRKYLTLKPALIPIGTLAQPTLRTSRSFYSRVKL